MRQADTRGAHCPGPLFEVIRLVRECSVGDTVAVIVADPAAGKSIPTWVSRAGHTLASIEDIDNGRRYLITRNR
ncbi:MAG: sulfurtransferase TusA family protein [Acidimicrobiia bacterium]|nr:sulfurtransferase TusA family protein [Acidimicrobiia bacterium]